MDRGRDAAAGEQILDLADRDDRQAGGLHAIEQRRRDGGSAKSWRFAVRAKCARRADERPRDDAADAEPIADELEGDLAAAIQLRDRHDVFVRGNLKHAVGRRVDDRRAGAHVLRAELVDDRRAGRRLVARTPPADAALELGDDVRAGSHSGNTGNGRSSTRPIISQWPVTESLPGDASAMRPYAPSGLGLRTVRR